MTLPRGASASYDARMTGHQATDEDRPCRVAVVTARAADAEAIAGRLQGSVANRASGFTAYIGGLHGHRVVVAVGEGGARSAANVLEAVLAAHRPRLVVAGGLCSGIAHPVRRGALVIADEVIDQAGKRLLLSADGWRPPGAVVGAVLSLDRPVRTIADKTSLAQRYGAVAVDEESFLLAEACSEQAVPFLSLRVATDGPDEELPKDIRRFLARGSSAGKAGALTGTLFRHPSHLKHLWRMKEAALEAGDKLADNIKRLVQDLPIDREYTRITGE